MSMTITTPSLVDDHEVVVDPRWQPLDLVSAVRDLLDPTKAIATIHWGRNYLYRTQLQTADGPVEVVVKQFRSRGLRDRFGSRSPGAKALKAWRMAYAFEAAGISTARPVMLVTSTLRDGAASFVSEYLGDRLELRYLLRAMNAESAEQDFPGIDTSSVLDAVGQAIARMHDANLFHRDLSIGNVFLRVPEDGRVRVGDISIIDLNRARQRNRIGFLDRLRDLSRLRLLRRKDQERFFRAYWHREDLGVLLPLCRFSQTAFRARIALKDTFKKAADTASSRSHGRYGHIPLPPSSAGARDRSVWDHLSDQPYQHAGKLEKTMARLADAPSHVRGLLTCLAAAPRVVRRYRKLRSELWQKPVPFDGLGVCLTPGPDGSALLLRAFDDLGVRHALVRLNPWNENFDAEETLARALKGRGCDITFALPQNRELVQDPARWKDIVSVLGRRFSPWGQTFQIGQAVNRSKWGIWREDEWVRLVKAAAEALAGLDVKLIGPAVIDFELYATASLVNRSRLGVELHALSSLLYVDRRGAPENTQAGFDTLGKAMLARAIAETARWCGPRSWITEVNWPLWEGPHSPAGPRVSVDEEHQADYLVRFYLWTLATGMAERVYWWQLAARGYGLMWSPAGDGVLVARKSYTAFATLMRNLSGWNCVGLLATDQPGAHVFRFVNAAGTMERLAAWSSGETTTISIPATIARVTEQDGSEAALESGNRVTVGSSVRYVDVARS